MMDAAGKGVTVAQLGSEERLLVRLAAAIAAGPETVMRSALSNALQGARAEWIEEVILQSYLFAGFLRTLNAEREWRRVSGRPAPAPASDEGERLDQAPEWQRRGEATCAVVYGRFYDRLRQNVRQLHPALDAWMIVEGYGKVLSRPGLDLARRELCIVAACAVSLQDRQLHSHLHGALHAGASPESISDTLREVAAMVRPHDASRQRLLWDRVRRSGNDDVH